jgi:hypothetical protein
VIEMKSRENACPVQCAAAKAAASSEASDGAMAVEAMVFQSVITYCENKLVAEGNKVASNDAAIRFSFK